MMLITFWREEEKCSDRRSHEEALFCSALYLHTGWVALAIIDVLH